MKINLISFTDSQLSLAGEIIPFFSPVGICIPWEKQLPVIIDNRDILPVYPPEDLKPDISFENTLNNCLIWLDEQGEKSRIELLKAGTDSGISDESIFRIKHLIKSSRSGVSAPDNRANKWHLIMHLAERIEENKNEANRMLGDHNKKPSPLDGSLDHTIDKPVHELIPEIDDSLLINEAHISHLLDAWFGLFGDIIREDKILMTFNRQIFDNLSQKWEKINSEKDLLNYEKPCFSIPLFSDLDAEKQKQLKSDEALKKKCIELLDTLSSDDIETGRGNDFFQKEFPDFESLFSGLMPDNHLQFTVLSFHLPAEKKLPDNNDITGLLSGKVLLFAEKAD